MENKRSEGILKEAWEMVQNAKAPECPEFFNDNRLEDAFLTSKTDEEGHSDCIPLISHINSYGKAKDGVLILSKKSADIESKSYTQYLDSEALVWDSVEERLFLYVPDPEEPRTAFKGSRWQFAKRLRFEYEGVLSLCDVYLDIMEENPNVALIREDK